MSNLVRVRLTIEHFEAPVEVWAALGAEIFTAAARLAEQTVSSDTEAEIELVQGSMKVRTVLAGALLAYSTIADYKSFKESVAEIAQDSRKFAAAVQEVIPKIVSQKQNIASQDVKKGAIYVTAEELSKLIAQMEKLQVNSPVMTEAAVSAELDKMARRLRTLKRQLDHKDIATVEQYLAQDLSEPTGAPPPRRPTSSREIVQPNLFEALRRRMEEKAIEHHLRMEAPRMELEPARRPRRMYFKRAPVRGNSDNLNPI